MSSFFLVSYRLPEDEPLERATKGATGKSFWRREFMNDVRCGELHSLSATMGTSEAAETLIGKFWFCDHAPPAGTPWSQDALSTEEIRELAAGGCRVRVISGPHATRELAMDSLEAWWEHDDF